MIRRARERRARRARMAAWDREARAELREWRRRCAALDKERGWH